MSEGTGHSAMESMAGGCERTFRNLVREVGRSGFFLLFESRASEE